MPTEGHAMFFLVLVAVPLVAVAVADFRSGVRPFDRLRG